METTGAATAAMRQALGAYGETLAARHLGERGMVVLERNWRCPAGEIDLVLRDRDTLVVCEVKTRSGVAFGTPHEAVTPAKVARLRELAARWLAEHDLAEREVRIDLVAVLHPPRGACAVEHVADIG